VDLFDYVRENTIKKESPLADRLRPTKLEDFVGQKHLIAEGKLLYRAIRADKLTSAIFYGPTGTGKTTLAKIIANTTKKHFEQLNAVTSGKADIINIVEEAKTRIGMNNKKTILFVDEIHRFNKLQQDALLPYVENGTIILIGATTENPFFEVNRALLSRSMIFKLEPLLIEDIKAVLERALKDNDKGLGMYETYVEEGALEYIASSANGDVRHALNAVELAVLTTPIGENGKINIDIKVASECVQKRLLNYDKGGDNHYDTISAFIKSMRGSDPDAAVYYLARMIESGEDIRFISRRIVICASEDVGNADPMALVVANSAASAADFVGLPEARIILSQAAVYVACAPKSNSSYNAINNAITDVKNISIKGVPSYLRGTGYQGAEELGNGVGYKYAHDYDNHYVTQQYLPDELKDKKYYYPGNLGYENKINDWMRKIKNNEGHQ
jgi:putative ATPase